MANVIRSPPWDTVAEVVASLGDVNRNPAKRNEKSESRKTVSRIAFPGRSRKQAVELKIEAIGINFDIVILVFIKPLRMFWTRSWLRFTATWLVSCGLRMSVLCWIYCALGLYRLFKIRKMVWLPDPGATRTRQPSPPGVHVGFQRWYAEQVLAPPDCQALLLPKLVRDNHLALLELWRPTIVRCLVADQVIVWVYDLSAVRPGRPGRPSWIGRRGLVL